MNLQGRVLIVTGSTGIGAATASRAAAEGARVVIATGDGVSGYELAQQIDAEVWVGDLTRPDSARSVVALCLSKFGRVDALFNVAGLSGRRFGDGPVHECTNEGWETTLAHNLGTMFHMSRAAIDRMLEQEVDETGTRGVLLNMGSVLADAPEPKHFATHAYAAAKGAVISMSRSMAAYYAPHKIRINVVAPGIVRTPASQSIQDPELQELIRRKQPLADGLIDTGDVANAVLFLLGGGSRSITGEVIAVDAGWKVSGG